MQKEKDSVKVAVRIRPVLTDDSDAAIKISGNNQVILWSFMHLQYVLNLTIFLLSYIF